MSQHIKCLAITMCLKYKDIMWKHKVSIYIIYEKQEQNVYIHKNTREEKSNIQENPNKQGYSITIELLYIKHSYIQIIHSSSQ